MIGSGARPAARPESTADQGFVPVCQVDTIERHHPSRGAQIIPAGMHRLSLIVGAWRCRRYHSAWGRACRQKRRSFLALSSMRETTGVRAGGLHRDSSSPLVTTILSDGGATFRPCPRSRTHRVTPAVREPAVGRLPLHGAQVPVGHSAHFDTQRTSSRATSPLGHRGAPSPPDQAGGGTARGRRCLAGQLVSTTEIGTPLEPRNVLRRFELLAQCAGLRGGRLHTLRHSAASFLLAAGTHTKVVPEHPGHSSYAITADIYSHVGPAQQRVAADRLDEALRW